MKLPLLLLATLPALAQTPTTLTPATFPATATTVEYYQKTDPTRSNYALTTTGSNHSWDFRSLVPSTAYTVPYQPVPAGSIAGTQWTLPRQAVIGGFYFEYLANQSLGPAGRMGLGRTVQRQATSLFGITGGSADSVVINRQTTLFGPSGVVDFSLPLTAGSHTRRTTRFATTGTITVQAFGLTNTPFRIVQRYLYVDSVAGWGTLRLPATGQATGTGALPVLHVRSATIRQDSIYLNGSPAPALLLAALSLTQGGYSTSFYDQFWRAGSAQPALQLYYPDDQFRIPYAADYSTEASLLPTRPAALPAASMAVWPNPAAPGQPLHVELRNADQPLTLTVHDAQGRLVLRRAVPAGQPLALPTGLPAGLYLVEAATATGRATTRIVVE